MSASGDESLKDQIHVKVKDSRYISFDFQYYKTYKMFYSIDSMHSNYGHLY